MYDNKVRRWTRDIKGYTSQLSKGNVDALNKKIQAQKEKISAFDDEIKRLNDKVKKTLKLLLLQKDK